ncbi:defender against death DAD protein [Hypoxylon trugodes]|uniref:defender against death DAD protein n=1 Tax=Hypoxylon trugodes TaxID=326681 RepID=UPI002199AA8C|nr:defender against death DAD protein [Hypoxylon trugodes]KAI1394135.1 defender against death DAD protein [Hypoxylon trugodes]
MAPKKSAAASAPAAPASTTAAATTTTTTASSSAAKTSTNVPQSIDQVAWNIVEHYQKTTPQRTKLIDVFMAFLVVVGGLQFAYCILAGNYPFNAFLSGFSATVGQFVLTASLRIQTTEANKSEFPAVSPERAFADYVVGSLILHFFCVNFIN